MSDKKLTGLSAASQKKKQEALLKTERAIAFLTESNRKITVRSVAREAGVSISYIYKYPELAYKIQRLREEQKYSLVVREASLKVDKKEVKLLRKKNEELMHKISELEAIIEQIKAGKKAGKNTAKSLKEENIRLATENIQLKQELEYTQENLQSARQFIVEQGRIELNLREEKKAELKRHKRF